MTTNVLTGEQPVEQISRLLYLIGQPARIQILAVIAHQEACVCHLEAVLGMRQASISQHLMALKKAGLVEAVREGRHVFYRLSNPRVTDLLNGAAAALGIEPEFLQRLAQHPIPGCPCPQCNPDLDPALTCRSLQERPPVEPVF